MACIERNIYRFYSEAVIWWCSVKKVFLKLSQNSLEKTCVRVSFFNKVAGPRPVTLLKKKLWHTCFPVNFSKNFKSTFFIEQLRWLFLIICILNEEK